MIIFVAQRKQGETKIRGRSICYFAYGHRTVDSKAGGIGILITFT